MWKCPRWRVTPEEHALARRRIRFYQRLGAHVLAGIRDNIQTAPDRPKITLHLMVHPRASLSPLRGLPPGSHFPAAPSSRLTGEVGYE